MGDLDAAFLCRRSRTKLGLRELRAHSTVAMGVVFALACVGTVVGYAVKRHYFPSKAAYAEFQDGSLH